MLPFKTANTLQNPHAHKEFEITQSVTRNGKSHHRHEEKPQKAATVIFGNDLLICWFISGTTADVYGVWHFIIRTGTHLLHSSLSGKANQKV